MNESSRVSRRRFLRQTAAVFGAAMTAPELVPASALGRDGAMPPSERITMGFIGVGRRGDNDRDVISGINQAVWGIDPKIRVLHGAGISSGQDVHHIIAAGAQGTGSTSGIIKAEDPLAMLEEMIRSVRMAWDATH